MPLAPTTDAMLCIWHDVEADHVEEYLRWHSFQHLPERLALPGFQLARRYERLEGPGQRFFCVLDVRALADFETPQYQARLDTPTEWTRRLMPRYGRVHRSLCRKLWELGAGLTGLAACVRIAGAGNAALIDALARLCTRQIALQTVAFAQLGGLEATVSNRDSAEKRLRRDEDSGGYDLVLLLGGLSRQSLHSALEDIEALLEKHRLRRESSLYALSCALGQNS
ncbi:hypothetical protein [Bosea sp. (in: a-proteobacteria)]|uniref:hypothetical protein n=1 Tax=Bosea sp. (in: a-proteobacteria) TaxID=1871050 RepID=UPI002FC9BFF5